MVLVRLGLFLLLLFLLLSLTFLPYSVGYQVGQVEVVFDGDPLPSKEQLRSLFVDNNLECLKPNEEIVFGDCRSKIRASKGIDYVSIIQEERAIIVDFSYGAQYLIAFQDRPSYHQQFLDEFGKILKDLKALGATRIRFAKFPVTSNSPLTVMPIGDFELYMLNLPEDEAK